MLDKLLNSVSELRDHLVFISFGGVGGIVYLLLSGKDFCLKAVLKAFFISAFTGLLVGLLVQYSGVGLPVAYAAAGLTGFAGGVALIWVLAYVQKKFGFATEEELRELREDVHRDRPPECSLSSLVRRREITLKDYKDILDGKIDSLTVLVMQGKLDGAVFEEIVRWSHSMNMAGTKE